MLNATKLLPVSHLAACHICASFSIPDMWQSGTTIQASICRSVSMTNLGKSVFFGEGGGGGGSDWPEIGRGNHLTQPQSSPTAPTVSSVPDSSFWISSGTWYPGAYMYTSRGPLASTL